MGGEVDCEDEDAMKMNAESEITKKEGKARSRTKPSAHIGMI